MKDDIVSNIGDGSVKDLIVFLCEETLDCGKGPEQCEKCAFDSVGNFDAWQKQQKENGGGIG